MNTRRTAKTSPTSDISPEWFNVIRRLQSVGRTGNRGLAILTIKVLVDARGKPCKLWGDPMVVKLEPCTSVQNEIEEILGKYSQEERQMILSALIDSLGREK